MKSKYSNIFSIFFFVIFFLYILFFIKPELVYHHQLSGFSFDKYSLLEYLAYPGGIAECLSLFLFQFNIYPVAGALVYTLITFLVVFITGKIIGSYKPFPLHYILMYLPGILIAGLFTDYSLHLVLILTVLILLLFFYVFAGILKRFKNSFIQIISFVVLSGLIYYISGGLAFLIFSLSAFIYVLSKTEVRSVFFAITVVVVALAVPYIASRLIFFISFKDAYFKLIPPYYYYEANILLYSLYFYLPYVLLVMIVVRTAPDLDNTIAGQPEKIPAVVWAQYIFLVLLFIVVVHFKFQKEQKHYILVDYYAYNKQWDKLLYLVKQKPSEDRLIQFHTNRALYHTGRLSESMFDYPQVWGVDGLFLSRYLIPGVLLPITELYMDLGHINDAVHWGNEAYSQNEDSPQILEQLIISNIIDNNYKSAQLYINSLRKYMFFRKKANDYERYINNEDMPDIDKIVKEKRSIMPVNDFVVNRQLPYLDLISLLGDNKYNKMAFEYLMAYFLLNNDLASFMKFISYARNFGYRHIPESYEEALTLYAYELQKRGKALGNLKLNRKTLDSFTDYLSILEKYKGDRASAKGELEKKYGNTYWFYIHYVSPVTTKKKIIIK